MNIKRIEKKENIIELRPAYDSAKSFYKKAMLKVSSAQYIDVNGYIVRDTITKIDLYSYNTLVLTIYKDIQKHAKDVYVLYKNILNDDLYSKTTLRHVKECLKTYYFHDVYSSIFDTCNYKKDIIFKNCLWM